jgi:flagellin-like protein
MARTILNKVSNLALRKLRRGTSPVLATVILIATALTLSTFVHYLYKETSLSYVKVEAIQYSFAYSAQVSEIENSRWKIVFNIINRGTEYAHISDIFINEAPIHEYGLTVDNGLMDSMNIGTSLPDDGVWLSPGEDVDVFVLIGEELFSSGTAVSLSVNLINAVEFNRIIILG